MLLSIFLRNHIVNLRITFLSAAHDFGKEFHSLFRVLMSFGALNKSRQLSRPLSLDRHLKNWNDAVSFFLTVASGSSCVIQD